LAVRPPSRPREALGERVRLGHQLARRGRLDQDLLQPRVGRERLPRLDPELTEHREKEAVALVNDLALVDVVQPRPALEPSRLDP
jgi:hypothetical protein